MTGVFADTFYFIAVLGADEQLRRRALAANGQFRQLVTTTAVLTEVANFMRQPHERGAFVEMVEALTTSADAIIESDHDLWRRGLELFGSRLDKEWSLTDCISFVVMTTRGLAAALTGDHHFEQAGFDALLK